MPDKGRLIDALARENMTELLQRLIETDPPADPVEKAQVQIAELRLRYADTSLSNEQQRQAYGNLLDAFRALIKSEPDHPQRPLWQTDLAAELLGEFLPVLHSHADLFYEFGVTTTAQRDVFISAATEAFEQAGDASQRFFEQRGQLLRQSAAAAQEDDGGLEQIQLDDYRLKRTPFYLAQAAYLTALLDDDVPYFAHLGHNVLVLDQAATPAEERKRLLALSLHVLEQSDLRDDPTAADAVWSLIGRVKLHQGDLRGADEALKHVSASVTGSTQLATELARAQLTARNRGVDAAAAQLAKLQKKPFVRDSLLYRLLAVDLEHRLRLAAISDPGEDTASAYQPYFALLADRSLGDRAEALRRYIYQRWTDNAGSDPRNLPPQVRMAIAQTLRERGQSALFAARQAKDSAAEVKAMTTLAQATRDNRALMDDHLPRTVQANAMFNLGMADYLQAGDQVPHLLDAAKLFVDCADQFPDQPISVQAIGNGMALLRSLHQQDPCPPGVDEAYRAAAKVLFDRYPNSDAADNERVYYAYQVLQHDGNNEQAVAFYRQVPPRHPSYFDAQREMLFAMEAYADPPQLAEAAKQVRKQAEAAQGESALRAAAASRLVMANLLDTQGDVDGALDSLADFESDYAGQDDLVSMALERRIVILAGANRPDPLSKAASEMMQRFPDDAAAVIDRVLSRMDKQIDRQRAIADDPGAIHTDREAARQRIDVLAHTAESLADLLVQWAWKQHFQPQQLVAYELIQVKVLLLSGQADRAAEVMQPLIQQYGDNLQVMHYAVETWFAKGDKPSLIQAVEYCDRIIGGVQPPYPDEYWAAWLRRLQVNDRLNQYADQIPATVRQLKLQDPSLGGLRYREQLELLSRKHGG